MCAHELRAIRHVHVDVAIPRDAERRHRRRGTRGGGSEGGINLNIATRAARRVIGGIKSLDAEALVGDEIIIAIEPEISGARDVFDLAHGVFHHEETITINGHICADAGAVERALGEDIFHRRRDDARADLHPGLPCTAGRGTGDLQRLAERICKIRARRFEGDGIGIGDVVADDIETVLELLDSTDTGLECAKHELFFWGVKVV